MENKKAYHIGERLRESNDFWSPSFLSSGQIISTLVSCEFIYMYFITSM